MIILAGLILGAIMGALRARKRGGDRKDIWQYAVVHAIIFALLAMFLTVGLHRTLD